MKDFRSRSLSRCDVYKICKRAKSLFVIHCFLRGAFNIGDLNRQAVGISVIFASRTSAR